MDLGKEYNIKVKVAAYVQNGQSKTTIGESMTCYVAGAKNKKYTNVKSVKLKKTSLTIKKGKNATIKATVSSDGKVKAKKKGKCTIYIFTRSGFARSVKVQVK